MAVANLFIGCSHGIRIWIVAPARSMKEPRSRSTHFLNTLKLVSFVSFVQDHVIGVRNYRFLLLAVGHLFFIDGSHWFQEDFLKTMTISSNGLLSTRFFYGRGFVKDLKKAERKEDEINIQRAKPPQNRPITWFHHNSPLNSTERAHKAKWWRQRDKNPIDQSFFFLFVVVVRFQATGQIRTEPKKMISISIESWTIRIDSSKGTSEPTNQFSIVLQKKTESKPMKLSRIPLTERPKVPFLFFCSKNKRI